jgi:hypothetical protein
MNALAAVLALLASVCFALAATLWQKAAFGLEGVSFRHPKSLLLLLTRRVWLLGLAAQSPVSFFKLPHSIGVVSRSSSPCW